MGGTREGRRCESHGDCGSLALLRMPLYGWMHSLCRRPAHPTHFAVCLPRSPAAASACDSSSNSNSSSSSNRNSSAYCVEPGSVAAVPAPAAAEQQPCCLWCIAQQWLQAWGDNLCLERFSAVGTHAAYKRAAHASPIATSAALHWFLVHECMRDPSRLSCSMVPQHTSTSAQWPMWPMAY